MSVTVEYPQAALPAPAREPFEHEQLVVRRGERSGVYTIIAVHSTLLGPSLGGARMWHYATVDEAIDDALRLSRAMTMKASLAGLDLGGGKAVICLPEGPAPAATLRNLILRDFADAINGLAGRYITAEDVGTTSTDMHVLAGYTNWVVGRPVEQGGSGDPGEFTAAGVEAAMRACCQQRFGDPDLAGRSIAVVGLGSVGGRLARRLRRAHARLVVSDIDPAREALAVELGADWVTPARALHADVDVLAPCALGGVIDEELARALRCRIVCGAANNQLAGDGLDELLAAREILYAPDFLVNAGGLINVSMELTGYDRARARGRAAELEHVVGRVLQQADRDGVTPLAAANALAERWLHGAGEQRERRSA